jgi:hypothetical protein
MGAIFLPFPLLALIPAVFFGLCFVKARKWIVLLGSFWWVVYAGYEYAMATKLLCTGECNIRIDLLLIYPFLLLVTLASLVSALRGSLIPNKQRNSDSGADAPPPVR